MAGANGLVGASLSRALAAGGEYARVIAITRRPLPFEAPRLVNRILRFEALDTELRGVACDDAYCCLGTTLRAAGSPAAFRAVDHDLVLRFARCAQAGGAKSLSIVSAAGATSQSRHLYLQVKGQTELALEALRFKALHIMQPSLLLGLRADQRTVESVGRLLMPLLNPLLIGRFERWRAIDADVVAAAMRAAVLAGRLGVHRYVYRALQTLARSGKMPTRM